MKFIDRIKEGILGYHPSRSRIKTYDNMFRELAKRIERLEREKNGLKHEPICALLCSRCIHKLPGDVNCKPARRWPGE